MGTPRVTYQSTRIGVRHGLMVLLFSGNLFMYCTRISLSVAMVAMVHHEPLNASSSSLSSAEVCPSPNISGSVSGSISPSSEHTFDMNSETQGLLHGAFYYGYLISQIPAGWIAHRIGAKLPIAFSMMALGIFSILSPLAADGGVAAFFTLLFLTGVAQIIPLSLLQLSFQGVIFPSVTVLWSQWAPPLERGRLLSVTYSGFQLGTVGGMSVSGLLAQSCGWESIFYCYGAICCLWVIPWMFLAYSSPEQHPKISKEERNYIVESIKNTPDKYGDQDTNENSNHRVPWLSIFKTIPFYALLIVEFGHSWGLYTLLTNLPTYLNNILHFSLRSNGALSAMPYLARWIVTLVTVFLADWMRTKDIWTPTIIRKFFSITGFLGAAAGLVGVAFVGCDSVAAVVLFTIAVGITGSLFAGHLINYTEMSPRYSGILIGIGNTVGTVSGIVAPYAVGTLTSGPNGQSVTNWQTVFYSGGTLFDDFRRLWCLWFSKEAGMG